MEKFEMREWIATLEQELDQKLKKWKKESRIENGEAIQVEYQFAQTHVILDIFWENGKEAVHLSYINPRASHRFSWHGLNSKTYNRILDRVGNLAQITMHPTIDPED